ncbi:hypothetical protein RI367_006986 [Sorochytrium milnesiophthora]
MSSLLLRPPSRKLLLATSYALLRPSLPRTLCPAVCRCLSSSTTRQSTVDVQAQAQSKRKQFMATTYDQQVLNDIKRLRLGLRPGQRNPMYAKVKDDTGLFKRVTFQAAAKLDSSFPEDNERFPEFAFLGRSNVGKSRLINAVLDTTIVRVKDKPGLTQSINWFACMPKPGAVGGRGCFAVDMPGYGFAFAAEEKKDTWLPLIERYLSQRKSLKRLFLLIDARHGFKANDLEFLQKLERLDGRMPSYQIVLTKCDLVEQSVLARRHRIMTDTMEQMRLTCRRDILMVSSKTGAGIERMRGILKQILPSPPQGVAAVPPTEPDY